MMGTLRLRIGLLLTSIPKEDRGKHENEIEIDFLVIKITLLFSN
jgi:hypothetical protein